jgi:hypothetical protein
MDRVEYRLAQRQRPLDRLGVTTPGSKPPIYRPFTLDDLSESGYSPAVDEIHVQLAKAVC